MTTSVQASGVGFTQDGVEFFPMTLAACDKLDVWMRHEARQRVRQEAREEVLRGELLAAYMDAGMRQANQLSVGMALEGNQLVTSYAGKLKILELSSRGKFDLKKLKMAKGEDLENPPAALVQYIVDLVDEVYELTKQPEEEPEEGDESTGEAGKDEVAPDPTTKAP